MTEIILATPNHPLYCLNDLIETRRNILRYARTFPPDAERNQPSASCRVAACAAQQQELASNQHKPRLTAMQKFSLT
jgi:hypothetical protein